ncbi:hypothetical protein P7K49_012261 [Saguinus oedipus]|uniref:Peptidyl-prolyl cis-trans isomerase n=1 Tax=Saguinus oedipus TaxID=9490 RepID=A0ABQ9VSZ5_SAGOE|nr:hypothetical protein P7K49_012261 [Saguinus oedipus]
MEQGRPLSRKREDGVCLLDNGKPWNISQLETHTVSTGLQKHNPEADSRMWPNKFGGRNGKIHIKYLYNHRGLCSCRCPRISCHQVNTATFYDIAEPSSHISFKLVADKVPKTAGNIHAVSTGEKGFGYKGSCYHRIIPGLLCQDGDITRHLDTSGKSFYGQKFDRENFILKHSGPGILCMANAGSDTNGSRVFTAKTEWWARRKVLFARCKEA